MEIKFSPKLQLEKEKEKRSHKKERKRDMEETYHQVRIGIDSEKIEPQR